MFFINMAVVQRLLVATVLSWCTCSVLVSTQDNGFDMGKSLAAAGPCGAAVSPCTVGERYGDPEDCSIYHQCADDGELVVKQCPVGKQFHYEVKKCRKRATCQPPCTEDVATESPLDDTTETNADNLDDGVERNSSDSEPEVNVTSFPEPNLNETETEINDTMALTESPVTVDEGIKDGGKEITTQTTTVTTTVQTTTTVSTLKHETTTAEVIKTGVPIITEGQPYEIITTAPERNDSLLIAGGGGGKAHVATIAGCAAGGFIIIVLIILAIVVFRKKRREKHEVFTTVENPQYRTRKEDKKPHAYRFSRDASLVVGSGKSRSKATANNNLYSSPSNKRPAPSPERPRSLEKRKAPPPPNPFTGKVDDDKVRMPLRRDSDDIYEKDSDGESNENIPLTTFGAPQLTVINERAKENDPENPFDDTFDDEDPERSRDENETRQPERGDESRDESRAPLIARLDQRDDDDDDEEGFAQTPGSPVQSRSTEYSSSSDTEEDSEEEVNQADDAEFDDGTVKVALQNGDKRDMANSLDDDYERTKNPFSDVAAYN